jgi:hypothetical protein
MTWDLFAEKLSGMGGIVEEFLEAEVKRSPSVQFRVDPLGELEPVSTHDQVLGGDSGQVFLGRASPLTIATGSTSRRGGSRLRVCWLQKGVLGRFAIDFLSVQQGEEWQHFAIEINLRKGGTTHPFMMLEFLTNGHYEPATACS